MRGKKKHKRPLNIPLTRFQQSEQTQSGFRDMARVPVNTEKYICCSAGQWTSAAILYMLSRISGEKNRLEESIQALWHAKSNPSVQQQAGGVVTLLQWSHTEVQPPQLGLFTCDECNGSIRDLFSYYIIKITQYAEISVFSSLNISYFQRFMYYLYFKCLFKVIKKVLGDKNKAMA